MIYLKPMGGLCNRLRSIDSLISVCKIEKRDLTVLWVLDNSLNCSFEDIFQTPIFEEFNFKVVDCPTGFPEKFVNNSCALTIENRIEQVPDSEILRFSKNLLKGRFLSDELQGIKKQLQNMSASCILVNEKLSRLYTSQDQVTDNSVTNMDASFIPIAHELVKTAMNSCEVTYISSCYRVFPLHGSYEFFVPVSRIVEKVNVTSNQFHNTFGLHIRRSDHTTSKSISTTDKFVKTVETTLAENDNATFFVSTDDGETKTELLRRFGEKIMTNEVSSYDRNNKNAVIDAMVDLYCLARTKKIYGSHHSSFSQTAANIGGIEEITVK